MTLRMTKSMVKSVLVCLFAVGHLPQAAHALALFNRDLPHMSVVKIYATIQREDYASPWQAGRAMQATGTGFIIAKRRILTNAHVVSDAKFLQVQKDRDARRFDAKIAFLGHDCDLAILRVDDTSFFENTSPMKLSASLPKLNDEVMVMGYPLGGDRLSVTRGVVSRIDYSTYAHSGVDQHLVLQVDAAINPGNSGGPIIYRGKAVALAFQGIAWAENIGYGIPVPVIRRFLDDVEDGSYDGYPELGVGFLDTRNTALRKHLKLPSDDGGIAVFYVDPFGSAEGHVLPGDVILTIDGYPIANDGTVNFDGNTVIFAELLERKQCGDSVTLAIWRDGVEQTIAVPLIKPNDPFLFRNCYGERPEYYVYGGLVFAPLGREYLRTMDRARIDSQAQQLIYYSEYAKVDRLYEGRDEFVVLIRVLPAAVNTYAGGFQDGIVAEINGMAITNLADVKKAMATPCDGFQIIKFEGMDDLLVMDAAAADAENPEILRSYGIPSEAHFSETQ